MKHSSMSQMRSLVYVEVSKRAMIGCTQKFSRKFSTQIQPAKRIDSFAKVPTVFSEFTPLAVKYNAANLGQGFPNFDCEDFIKLNTNQAVQNNYNQYTRSQGHVKLVNQIASFYGGEGENRLGRRIDPLNEVVVTVGASEALFTTMQAFINEGDEVVLIEPFYDSYPADVVLAGGVPKFVPLRPQGDPYVAANWKLDINELEKSITPKTKMILINTPQNVPGKVYTVDELEGIAKIAKRHNLLVVCDEVYEWLVYDNFQHTHMASLKDMWERTITISSAGKTFSVTGFKIGWVIAPRHLCTTIQMVHQWNIFAVATPFQESIANTLEDVNTRTKYLPYLQSFYTKKRDLLLGVLERVGLKPIRPQGSYFILADVSKINTNVYENFTPQTGEAVEPKTKDYQFCRWLTTQIGVAAIPLSPFYTADNSHIGKDYVRFCFCKTDETILVAEERLKKLANFTK